MKPLVLLTSGIHPREMITSQMTLYAVMKLLHGGIVHKDPFYVNLLRQNVYQIIPTINVDGLAYIEKNWRENGVFKDKRTNMNLHQGKNCEDTEAGIDLNRNWGYDFGVGSG